MLIYLDKYSNLKLSIIENNMISDITNVLGLFYDATLKFSSSKYPNIGLVLPVYYAIVSRLKEHNDKDSCFKNTLKKVLLYYTEFYINKYIISNKKLFATAMFLNIRSKMFSKLEEREKKTHFQLAYELINEMCSDAPSDIKKLTYSCSDSSKRTAFSDLSNTLDIDDIPQPPKKKNKKNWSPLEIELEKYKAELPKSMDTVEYWRANKDVYPALFYCSKRIFILPATSVPAERLFSLSGYNIWDRRNRLHPERAEKIMVVFNNQC